MASTIDRVVISSALQGTPSELHPHQLESRKDSIDTTSTESPSTCRSERPAILSWDSGYASIRRSRLPSSTGDGNDSRAPIPEVIKNSGLIDSLTPFNPSLSTVSPALAMFSRRRDSVPVTLRPRLPETQDEKQRVYSLRIKRASSLSLERVPRGELTQLPDLPARVSYYQQVTEGSETIHGLEPPEPAHLPVKVEREGDLVQPNPSPAENISPSTSDEDHDIDLEKGAASSVTGSSAVLEEHAAINEKTKPPPKLSAWARFKANFYAIYSPREDPELILPTSPTDQEKLSYLRTNRLPFYAAGVFSFCSLTTGMWLFTVSAPIFSWFGVMCGALQIYMGISYYVGLVGKDFDYEHHKKTLEENPVDPVTCPTVDIYLPVCKEPLPILENTWKHISKLEYPEGKMKVYVLDDGAMPAVEALANRFGFEYIVRDDRPRLKKAGNLRWAFARTSGDFFNIYDADFCPRTDFLLEIIPRMLGDPKIAIVQTPQYFRTRSDQTWVEQGAGAVQELFYRVIQVNRDRWGASICVGSNALYRREALEEVGGTAEIGFSEDVHTGFGCVDRGWKVRYVPLCLACGVCPDSPRAFFSQQMRWCMGSTTLLSNPEFWKSKLTRMQKVCYLCGMMYYSACALSIFVNPLPGIFLLWFRPEYFKYYNLAFALPSLLYTMITFRLWAKASYGMNVQFIMVIQSYAYLTAIKDRIFGRALMWAPSGDNKAHKNNKYRNMRILAWSWLITWEGALVAAMIYRITKGLPWYQCIPLLALDLFNLFLAHRFLLCKG